MDHQVAELNISDLDGPQPHKLNCEKSRSSTADYLHIIFRSSFNAFLQLVKPCAPQLLPVVVCITLFPSVLLISIIAGYLVWSNAAVSWNVPVYLQYGDGNAPYAFAQLPNLASQQLYDISIQLIIPAVESNFALGNFMTTLTLSTPSNRTIASIRQPAIAYFSPPSLFRSSPNTITLLVPMFSGFRLSSSSELVAYIQLGRSDNWHGVGAGLARELSVIASVIRGEAMYHGIRGLVAYYPLTSAVLSAGTFLAILLFILAACILSTGLRRVVVSDNYKELPMYERQSSSAPPEINVKPIIKRRGTKVRTVSRRSNVN